MKELNVFKKELKLMVSFCGFDGIIEVCGIIKLLDS